MLVVLKMLHSDLTPMPTAAFTADVAGAVGLLTVPAGPSSHRDG